MYRIGLYLHLKKKKKRDLCVKENNNNCLAQSLKMPCMHHTSDHFYLISRLLETLLLLLLIQLTASRSATSVTALALSCLPNLLYNPCTPGIIESYLVWILLFYHPCYAQAWWTNEISLLMYSILKWNKLKTCTGETGDLASASSVHSVPYSSELQKLCRTLFKRKQNIVYIH